MTPSEVEAAASWFDSFLKHGSAISVLLALIFGWCLALLLRFPLHKLLADDDTSTYVARVCCVVGSFAITYITWPNDFRLAWALTMGVASPVLGLVAIVILGKWK